MNVARISFVSNINSIKIVFANLYIFSVLKSTSTLKNLSIAVYMLLMNLSLPKTNFFYLVWNQCSKRRRKLPSYTDYAVSFLKQP